MTVSITKIKHRLIPNPALHVALYRPEIPANTGNIARLCGAAEIRLHLIHPLGFKVDDKHLKRAGLDYWPEVDVRHHMDFGEFVKSAEKGKRLLVFTKHGDVPYTKAVIHDGDYLLFGQETKGLPLAIREAYACYAIPMWGKVRSLNLSTAVGIVAYHYLHKLGRF